MDKKYTEIIFKEHTFGRCIEQANGCVVQKK